MGSMTPKIQLLANVISRPIGINDVKVIPLHIRFQRIANMFQDGQILPGLLPDFNIITIKCPQLLKGHAAFDEDAAHILHTIAISRKLSGFGERLAVCCSIRQRQRFYILRHIFRCYIVDNGDGDAIADHCEEQKGKQNKEYTCHDLTDSLHVSLLNASHK